MKSNVFSFDLQWRTTCDWLLYPLWQKKSKTSSFYGVNLRDDNGTMVHSRFWQSESRRVFLYFIRQITSNVPFVNHEYVVFNVTTNLRTIRFSYEIHMGPFGTILLASSLRVQRSRHRSFDFGDVRFRREDRQKCLFQNTFMSLWVSKRMMCNDENTMSSSQLINTASGVSVI